MLSALHNLPEYYAGVAVKARFAVFGYFGLI